MDFFLIRVLVLFGIKDFFKINKSNMYINVYKYMCFRYLILGIYRIFEVVVLGYEYLFLDFFI